MVLGVPIQVLRGCPIQVLGGAHSGPRGAHSPRERARFSYGGGKATVKMDPNGLAHPNVGL
jgi:hypothetical protein